MSTENLNQLTSQKNPESELLVSFTPEKSMSSEKSNSDQSEVLTGKAFGDELKSSTTMNPDLMSKSENIQSDPFSHPMKNPGLINNESGESHTKSTKIEQNVLMSDRALEDETFHFQNVSFDESKVKMELSTDDKYGFGFEDNKGDAFQESKVFQKTDDFQSNVASSDNFYSDLLTRDNYYNQTDMGQTNDNLGAFNTFEAEDTQRSNPFGGFDTGMSKALHTHDSSSPDIDDSVDVLSHPVMGVRELSPDVVKGVDAAALIGTEREESHDLKAEDHGFRKPEDITDLMAESNKSENDEDLSNSQSPEPAMQKSATSESFGSDVSGNDNFDFYRYENNSKNADSNIIKEEEEDISPEIERPFITSKYGAANILATEMSERSKDPLPVMSENAVVEDRGGLVSVDEPEMHYQESVIPVLSESVDLGFEKFQADEPEKDIINKIKVPIEEIVTSESTLPMVVNDASHENDSQQIKAEVESDGPDQVNQEVEASRKEIAVTKTEKIPQEDVMIDEVSQSSCAFCQSILTKSSDLLYWRDVKKSGVAFGLGLVVLFSLAFCSVISVVAYTSLLTLLGTVSYRIYSTVLQAVQKKDGGHPFRDYLEIDIRPSKERVHQMVDDALVPLSDILKKLRNVFLVEDVVDSLKFVGLFWILTYIGSWFNGITLLILAHLALFSLPKLYEMNKSVVDQYLELARAQLGDLYSKVRAKIPLGSVKKEKSQ